MNDALISSSVLILLFAVGFVIIRAVRVLGQRPKYSDYWAELSQQQFKKDDLRLLVIGDSIMQGIGASKPTAGLAGLIATYIADETGRKVHITNLSRSGAKVHDVVHSQLPHARFKSADIVVVSVSANDSTRKTPIEKYTADIQLLMQTLPADKTIVADVPGVHHREQYQPILQEAADKYGIKRAKLVEAFARIPKATGVTAGDFFHPNDKGYEIWFSAFRPEIDKLLPQLKSSSQ